MQKYTPLLNNRHHQSGIKPKSHSPWISKLQNTVQSFKRNIKYKVNQLLDTTSLSSLDNNPLVYNPNYNPNRKGLAKSIVAFPALSPLGSVLSSIITSLSVTSLAFTRELVFGASIKAGEDGWESSPLINFRAPFVSAIFAVCEVLSTGIRYVLQIEGGGCGLGGDGQKYGKNRCFYGKVVGLIFAYRYRLS